MWRKMVLNYESYVNGGLKWGSLWAEDIRNVKGLSSKVKKFTLA